MRCSSEPYYRAERIRALLSHLLQGVHLVAPRLGQRHRHLRLPQLPLPLGQRAFEAVHLHRDLALERAAHRGVPVRGCG